MHFTDHELRTWGRGGPGSDRERVIAHLAECPSCAQRYASAVVDARMAGAEATDQDADQFRQAARAAGRRRRARWVPLAAAAALLLAVGIPYALRTRPSPGIVLRGSAIQPLGPAGSVDAGAPFEWSTDVDAAAFQLRIGDSTGTIVTTRSRGTRAALEPGAWRKLSPGIDYWWQVAALNGSGQVVAESSRQSFRIRQP